MFGQAHAGLGWLIGVSTPGADRRLRAWCVVAALLPDIDAIPIVFGYDAYARWHHTFGHNVFLGLLILFAAAWHFGGRPAKQRSLAVSIIGLCWASHILTDMKLSGWELYFLWPINRNPWQFHPMLSLGDPINFFVVYALMGAVLPLALWRKVTPLEILSPRLDRLLVNAFRKKSLDCATCGKACNNRCDSCSAPVCMKHGRLTGWFRTFCPMCPKKTVS
jgi:hypothetical protein